MSPASLCTVVQIRQRAPQQSFFCNNKLRFSGLTSNQVVIRALLLISGSALAPQALDYLLRRHLMPGYCHVYWSRVSFYEKSRSCMHLITSYRPPAVAALSTGISMVLGRDWADGDDVSDKRHRLSGHSTPMVPVKTMVLPWRIIK